MYKVQVSNVFESMQYKKTCKLFEFIMKLIWGTVEPVNVIFSIAIVTNTALTRRRR